MAHIRRRQVSAMGIHYLYYPLEYMLDTQAAAGFQTIELVGMAPHFLIDHSGYGGWPKKEDLRSGVLRRNAPSTSI